MNRRDFFRIGNTASPRKKTSVYSHTSQSGLQMYDGTWSEQEVTHLLSRTMFGAKKIDIDYFTNLTMENAVEEMLIEPPSVSQPLRDYDVLMHSEGAYDDPNVAKGSTWVNDLTKIEDPGVQALVFRTRAESLRKWWIGLMVNQERNISEKLTLFWHHHFSVQYEEVAHPIMLYRHHTLLRQHAMKNARELTKQITVDPAMLYHLNGYLNTKVAPDENYARELQELFTVGKGMDSLYTESDVMEAARVLTGWRVDRDLLTSYIDEAGHDTGIKKFSSFYNNTSISGSSNGMHEVNELINMIFDTVECSRFLCRKLYRWFVNSVIDDNVEANVIKPLADMLRNGNYEIKPVLAVLFKSEHFYDLANRSCYIKSPVDFVVGAMREFGVQLPPVSDYVNGYPLFFSLYERSAAMGMDLFQPPDVNGWPAYVQEPMYYDIWINSNSLPRRADFTNAMIEDGVIDLKSFVQSSCTDPSDPDQVVANVTARLLKYPLSDNARIFIRNKFLLKDSGDKYQWTNTWNSNDESAIQASLKQLFSFICNLPEYHLC